MMAVRSMWIAILWSVASGENLMHNPLVVGQTFMAGSTDPTAGSTGWALTSHGIAEKLFTVDSDGHIVGQVAESVSKIDVNTWEVTLRPSYKFSDGTAVTAQLVSEALTRLNQENSGASASVGDMTMTPVDNLRFKISSERATPVMAAVLAEWPFVIFMQKDGKFLFTGPYAVETFKTNEQIDLIPNPHYPRASERPLLVIKKFANGASLASAVEGGEVDLAFHLPVDSLPGLRQVSGVTVKSFLVGYQYMMWHNMDQIGDVKVRKAIDIALDRHALQQEVKAGQETRSLFPRNSPYYYADAGDLHFDKEEAERLLNEAGWLKNNAGIRTKAGAPLSLRVVAYPQRPALATMLPVVEKALKDLGIAVFTTLTSGESWDQLDTIIANKDYDLLLWAQHTLPAGDPQFFLSHFFRSNSGGNKAGLVSAEVDNLLDALSHAESEANRIRATAEAHKAILDLVPVSVLMTPSWHVGLSSRLKNYKPYGSDYYIIHSDFALEAPESTTTVVASQEGEGLDANGSQHVVTSIFLCAILFLYVLDSSFV